MQKPSKFLIIALSLVCGLMIGGILLVVSYDFGIICSCGLVGGMLYAIVKNRTSETGLGRVFGFISCIIGWFVYRMIIYAFLQFSIVICLIVYFAPYILAACGFIVLEKQKNKPKVCTQTAPKNGEPTTIPKTAMVDPYFIDAGRMIIEKNKVSTATLQRMYQIGYERASQIIEQLCTAGVIRKADGTASWEILMTRQEFEDYLNENGYK